MAAAGCDGRPDAAGAAAPYAQNTDTNYFLRSQGDPPPIRIGTVISLQRCRHALVQPTSPPSLGELPMISLTSILLPDRVGLAGRRSLTSIRDDLARRNIQRAPMAGDNHARSSENRAAGDEEHQVDPLTAPVLSHAATGAISIVAAAPECDYGYAVAATAWNSGELGFRPWETLCTGRLVLVPSLLRHGSLEIGLDGAPIYAIPTEIDRILGRRPLGRGPLHKIVKTVIDEAVSSGERPTNNDLIMRVLHQPSVQGVSKRQIVEIIYQLKPTDWKRPGPRSGRQSDRKN